MAEGGERVQRVCLVQRQLGVVGEVIGLRTGLAQLLAVAAFAGFARVGLAVLAEINAGAIRHGAGHVGAFQDADIGAEAEEPVIGQLEALVDLALATRTEITLATHSVGVLPVQGTATAAGAVGFEDDVDHPGNRVRTVLRRRAVAQHFHMVYRTDGDQVEVGG
ncbi:hypothetical protein D3C75_486100 [compost metagenome]